ncbi:uncharacterized protein LOC118194143 isoform X2 [Stegodyphus dumicola]|uniref:uncharacterized protein LOC118194143 isoform X2 n=1 Tax=Stegodyphus dumicola TaxID=202533 RepID=UPI0015AACC77|nr:uncharacterized protein LOC118194143 isoform X2 [Stegodyphus dumicola]
MSEENSNDVNTEEHLSLEDCNALLQFPYHKYTAEVKKEINAGISDSKVEVPSIVNNEINSSVSKPAEKVVTDNLKEDLKRFQGKNLAVQEKIVEALSRIETTMQRLDTCRREARTLHKALLKEEKPDKSKRGALLRPISLFAAPYFRDVRGMVPPDNEDTKAKMKNNIINAYLVPPKPWLARENKMLLHGVMSNTLAEILKPYQIKRNYLKEKLKDKNISDSEMQEIKEELISEIEMQMKEIKKIPVTDLLKRRESDIDWMTISATYMEGMRDPEECENMWNNFLSNSINKKPFTAAEDAKLREIAERYNELNWDIIAKELGVC